MKKLYYATFIPGMERAVEGLLRREGGVTIERMLSGAVLYRSVKELQLSYMHHNFLVLTQLHGIADVDAAVKKLLSSGDWLDRIPYEETKDKRFRIVTMDRDKLVPVNMRYLNMLEKAIIEQTGMKTLRERPDVELWIARRSEGMTLFLWRLGSKRSVKPEKPGALRADVCTIVSALARIGGKNALNLLCSEETLLRALKNAGARTVTGVCEKAETQSALSRVQGVRVVCQNPLNLSFADGEMDAVVVHLPEQLEAAQPEAFLRGLLSEARRVLDDKGRIVLIGVRAQADNAVARAPGLATAESFDILLSGRKCSVWILEKEEDAQ